MLKVVERLPYWLRLVLFWCGALAITVLLGTFYVDWQSQPQEQLSPLPAWSANVILFLFPGVMFVGPLVLLLQFPWLGRRRSLTVAEGVWIAQGASLLLWPAVVSTGFVDGLEAYLGWFITQFVLALAAVAISVHILWHWRLIVDRLREIPGLIVVLSFSGLSLYLAFADPVMI